MRLITYVVVHTAAAATSKGEPVYQTVKQIHDYHVKHNLWRKGGYHAVIQQDGLVSRNPQYTRTDDEVGAHAGGFNEHSLGVCVTGHGDFADFNPRQLESLIDLCASWCRTYGLKAAKVIGHRETDEHGGPIVHKTCPGTKVDMNKIRALVAAALGG